MSVKRRALFSVTNKSGLEHFAPLLSDGWEFISTGGTAKAMRELGMTITDVAEVTGFPEMMDGRLKTLHPAIHGGILARRDNPDDMAACAEQGIEMIDLVVVNLYDFAGKPSLEQIDIGGPTMLRSAAKNHQDVIVLVHPEDYRDVVQQLILDGNITLSSRRLLARKVFEETRDYDRAIANWM